MGSDSYGRDDRHVGLTWAVAVPFTVAATVAISAHLMRYGFPTLCSLFEDLEISGTIRA